MHKILIILAAAPLVASTASAQDAGRGQELAKRWCSACHVVGENTTGGDAGPPFADVAVDDTLTDDGLRLWLADPHSPMPNLQLSEPEISDIIAYIRSL
ncbi:c-type cytochrome [Halovulum sp. GXIMD14793]